MTINKKPYGDFENLFFCFQLPTKRINAEMFLIWFDIPFNGYTVCLFFRGSFPYNAIDTPANENSLSSTTASFKKQVIVCDSLLANHNNGNLNFVCLSIMILRRKEKSRSETNFADVVMFWLLDSIIRLQIFFSMSNGIKVTL